jgi:peptidoglycan hydrolase-like protein with peptidoglycan-binding domain
MGVEVHQPEPRMTVPPPPSSVSAVPAYPGRVLGRPDRGNVESRGRSVLIWQSQMAARGWILNPDGIYGYVTELVCRQFQEEKALQVDGLVGPETWKAAWEAPITAPTWTIDGSRILDE